MFIDPFLVDKSFCILLNNTVERVDFTVSTWLFAFFFFIILITTTVKVGVLFVTCSMLSPLLSGPCLCKLVF